MRHKGNQNRNLRDKKTETGAAAVEFAIVLPLLVLVFTGMIEYGRLMWNYNALAKATRDAARFLSMEPAIKPTDAAQTSAKTMVINATADAGMKDENGPLVTASDVAIVCSPDCTNPITVSVNINYSHTIGEWIPVISSRSGATFNQVNLRPHTTMRYMR